MRCLKSPLALLVVFVLSGQIHAESPKVLEVQRRTSTVAGMPVHWSSHEIALLTREGKLEVFPAADVSSHRLTSRGFIPQSPLEAKVELQRELGAQFETRVAGPYVIAAPKGQVRRWQARFSALLAGYERYFQVRGWNLRRPDFPLVVIVFPTRNQFQAYAAREKGKLPSQAVGGYFTHSNRCILYQIPGRNGTNWDETEATIVHEAVHQIAYNTGVHERLFRNPLWFAEGLATMFERPEVYELGLGRSRTEHRVHGYQLQTAAPNLTDPERLKPLLQNLVASDDLFQSNTQLAYALSWSLSFYLAEKMPSRYQALMRVQRARPFGDYTARERTRDFQKAVGVPFELLANHVSRFYVDLLDNAQ
ncbi:MAG: DUF1570 domain-containing protein [Pirellulaceae bacterium]